MMGRQGYAPGVDVTVNKAAIIRSVSYTKDMGDAICALLAEGNSMRSICRMFGLAPSTVCGWADAHPEFAEQSRRAREIGCDVLAEQCLEIADTPVEGVETTLKADGTTEEKRGDMLGHRRLQIDTRLRLIGKWHQHRYGDKVQTEHSGHVSHTISATTATDDQLAQIALGGAQ